MILSNISEFNLKSIILSIFFLIFKKAVSRILNITVKKCINYAVIGTEAVCIVYTVLGTQWVTQWVLGFVFRPKTHRWVIGLDPKPILGWVGLGWVRVLLGCAEV